MMRYLLRVKHCKLNLYNFDNQLFRVNFIKMFIIH